VPQSFALRNPGGEFENAGGDSCVATIIPNSQLPLHQVPQSFALRNPGGEFESAGGDTRATTVIHFLYHV
jgi:hypothetical protein